MKKVIFICMSVILLAGCSSDSELVDDKSKFNEEVAVNPMDGLNSTLFESEDSMREWLHNVTWTACTDQLYDSFVVESEYGTRHHFLSVSPESYNIQDGVSVPAQYYEVPAKGGSFKIYGLAERPLSPGRITSWMDGIYVFKVIHVDEDGNNGMPEYLEYEKLSDNLKGELPVMWVENASDGLENGIACFKVPENKTGKKRSLIMHWSYWDDYSYSATNIGEPYMSYGSLEIVQMP